MDPYFNVVGPIDLDALGHFVAAYLELPRERVCVYDNTSDIDPPFEGTPAGVLWGAHECADVAVPVGHAEPGAGPVGGWFCLQWLRSSKTVDVRACARAAAAFLKTPILFPDPVPGDTSDYADAAQIEITSQGVERKVWLVEFGENGHSKNLIEMRD